MSSPPCEPDPSDLRNHPAIEAVNDAVRVGHEGSLDQAVAGLTAVVARFEDDPVMEARLGVASALFNKGLALSALGRAASALEALEAATERFATDEDPLVRIEAAGALRNKVALLTAAGRIEEALDASSMSVACFGHDAEPAIKNTVCDGLTDFGTALAGLGRSDDAVNVFGQVIEVCAGGEDPDSRTDVAMARYHRAIVLRDAGRRDEALVEFRLGLAVVGDDMDPSLAAMAARLHYNTAVVLHDLDRFEEAIEHYSVIERRFPFSDDPDLRSWVARSLYNHGSGQVSLGRFDDAVATWDRISQRLGTGADSKTSELAQAVEEQTQWLEDMRNRPHHVWTNLFERSLASLYEAYVKTGVDPESGSPVSPEVAQSYVLDHREQLERFDALAGDRHEAAVSILWDYRDRDRPFVLFLRNFDLEAYVGVGSHRLLMLGGQRPSSVEEHLMELWPARLPIVGIANPVHSLQSALFGGDIMPRLEISRDRWLDRVSDLVRHAALIVIAAREASPGLSAELGAIRHAGREKVTVIVLVTGEDAFEADIARLYGVPRPRSRPRRPSSRMFAPFPYVLGAETVPWDLIGTAGSASDVVEAVSAAVPVPPRRGWLPWSRP